MQKTATDCPEEYAVWAESMDQEFFDIIDSLSVIYGPGAPYEISLESITV